MSQDFLGYKRDVKPNGHLLSAENATFSMGTGGRMGLVQSVSASYKQEVNSHFEVGSSAMYWVTGKPEGTVDIARFIGRDGLRAMEAVADSCGTIQSLNIGFDGEKGCETAVDVRFGKKLQFSGAVFVSYGISFGAGALEVAESASMRVASLR